MFVALIGKNTMYKINLPKFPNGSYWIKDDNNKKIINIDGINGNWVIHSNKDIKILKTRTNKSSIIDSAILKEYSMNYIYSEKSRKVYCLYCAPIMEKYIYADLKNKGEISIGRSEKNDIIYYSPLVKPVHAKIFYSNNVLLIENYDTKFGTFVNNKPVTKKRKFIFNGDVIFIMGLKIIKVGTHIFINMPFKSVSINKKKFIANNEKIRVDDIKEEDENDIEIYSEEDYFTRAPRITSLIEREKISIDGPPQMEKKGGMPLMYVLGSSLAMGLISVVSIVSAIDSLLEGTATLKSTIFSILVSGIMLLSMILLPIFNERYEKREKIKYEETRQKRYRKYINSKIKTIDEIMEKQSNILFENYLSDEECANIVYNKSSRLWERTIEDDEFLKVRLGTGDIPLEVDIDYPKEQFTMEDDDLVEILNILANKSKILKDVPITISIAEKNILAAVIERNERLKEKFMQTLILQLVTLQSYEDLKLVFFLNNDQKSNWEHIKMLPHVWDNMKQIRFFADEYKDMEEISRYLMQEVNYRKSKENDLNYKSFKPYYVIITDNYKKIENLKIIQDIRKMKKNIGFSIICLSENYTDLPNECQTFINIEGRKGKVFDRARISKNENEFVFDDSYTFFFEKVSKSLSNIPIKFNTQEQAFLPENYSFLEMYDVGKIEALNIWERWKSNDTCTSLQAPIGVDALGNTIFLDVHEKVHGPHGLIAGSTGSGKSEFIITYILSMAVNYHPDDVAFVLIDYKGGSLAGAFQKKNIKLPHLVGTITNIDTVGLKRSLASIQSELRRRQILFNEARERTNEGTIDIYKYQKMYHTGSVEKPIPHLLIICDEFAELKQQQEDFMNELISVARIGRSLGVHLILATQKPAGVVNDQIRSNSKFGICLKVQEREDSQDVIKRPDAAELKKVGQFYMQVGNNEYFVLGQSAWAGAPYYPSDVTKKKASSSIEFISNIGRVLKEVDIKKETPVDKDGEQLTNIVISIDKLAKRENIKTENLWIDSIPPTIYINDIRKKYKVQNKENVIKAVIGEFDDPFNQRQGALFMNLSKDGNTIIFGNAESGKETLLSTLVYDLISNYQADDIEIYLLDFGTEALKIFKKSPQVGDVVFLNEKEKLQRFFDMIQKEMARRISVLSEYGGDYNLYINTENEKMPMILVVMNSYELFFEMYEYQYDDLFLTLTRDGVKYGIVFVVTASNPSDVRYRLLQNFKQKLALQLNNEDDYMGVFEGVRDKRPSKEFGRGLVKLEDIYEFQTAKICDGKNWNTYIKQTIEDLNNKSKVFAKEIPVLPERVEISEMQQYIDGINNVPIGLNKKNLEVYNYDFKKNFVSIITAKNLDIVISFIMNLIEEIKVLDNLDIEIFDAEKALKNAKNSWKLDYENFKLGIKHNLNKNKHKLCLILGIDKFISEIEDGEEGFLNILEETEKLENYSFIIVEGATRLKQHEYDEWYKNYVSGDDGIWLGKGVDDQYILNISSDRKELENNCGDSFAHVIKEGEATIVKIIGMRDK